MILLREIQDRDLDALERFAQIPGMFNLPGDRDLLKERIQKSRSSFSGKQKTKSETKYVFVAEDLKSKKVLATSMIAGQHGTPESPHFYFEVDHEKRFSEAIGTGFIHGTLTLKIDTDGPSEIGALVVDPESRNHEARIGRQIAFVRFLYLATHRDRFQPKVIAELLPPLNKRGLSPLWEAIGRRFTNMDYWEADQLCAKNKDFIFDLFPSGKIYTTFFPAEAKNAIGKVGKDTQPIMHMLTKIGFKYKNQVDPFDGGPHFWADVEQITPVKRLKKSKWSDVKSILAESAAESGLLAKDSQPVGEFRAVHLDESTSDKEVADTLSLNPGDSISFMPYY